MARGQSAPGNGSAHAATAIAGKGGGPCY